MVPCSLYLPVITIFLCPIYLSSTFPRSRRNAPSSLSASFACAFKQGDHEQETPTLGDSCFPHARRKPPDIRALRRTLSSCGIQPLRGLREVPRGIPARIVYRRFYQSRKLRRFPAVWPDLSPRLCLHVALAIREKHSFPPLYQICKERKMAFLLEFRQILIVTGYKNRVSKYC